MNEEDIKKMKYVKGEVTNFINTSLVICENPYWSNNTNLA